MSSIAYKMHSIATGKDDEHWVAHWEKVWPHCRAWYVSEGLLRRPSFSRCSKAIKAHMPELSELYSKLCEQVGGGDLESRFLSLYSPPPYMAGCSQAVWNKDELFLVKNYDYSDKLFEKTLLHSHWMKPVIGVLDCTWGLLDGINADGLIASLTFGGKKDIGEGFGAPLIVRYVLETCSTVEEAKAKMAYIPCHMSYNITLLDGSGAFSTAFLRPGVPAQFVDDPVCTNHQSSIEWMEYAEFSNTLGRHEFLKNKLQEANAQSLVQSFFAPPLFNTNFEQQFGTLYTVVYRPKELNLYLMWPDQTHMQSFTSYSESTFDISIRELES